MLEFKTEQRGQQGSIQAFQGSTLVGHVDFVPCGPGAIDLIHTRVFAEFEGRGFGRVLVKEAALWARAHGLKLRATCPYAAVVLDRSVELHDVWEPSSDNPS